MWWIPVTFAGTYIIKKVLEKDKQTSSSPTTKTYTALEFNILRLKSELGRHSDKKKVAIFGQPGSGKSTTLDNLTNYQCKPRPKIGQRTDTTDWSKDRDINLLHFYEDKLFVDVPGYNTASHPVKDFIKHFPFEEFDFYLFVIKGKVYEADNQLWQAIKNKNLENKVLIIRTFSDQLIEEDEKEIQYDMEKQFGGKFIFLSNRYKTGLENVLNFINNKTIIK